MNVYQLYLMVNTDKMEHVSIKAAIQKNIGHRRGVSFGGIDHMSTIVNVHMPRAPIASLTRATVQG